MNMLRLLLALLLAFAPVAARPAPAAAPASVAAPAAPVPSERGVRLTWAGGPTLLIRFGPIRILTDPVLGEGPEAFRIFDPNSGTPDAAQARLVPLPDLPFERSDLVLVSHDHEDHLDSTAVSRLGGRLGFVVPAAQAGKVRARGVARVTPLAWGRSLEIARNGYSVSIIAVPGRHSERADLLGLLGEVNGYWLEFRRRGYRRTLYWTGDSFQPPEGLPKRFRSPDLFVPHLGGVGAGGSLGHVSMGARHAVAFARLVKPRSVLPIHHSTFSLYREPIQVFAEAASAAGIRVERIAEGDSVLLP